MASDSEISNSCAFKSHTVFLGYPITISVIDIENRVAGKESRNVIRAGGLNEIAMFCVKELP